MEVIVLPHVVIKPLIRDRRHRLSDIPERRRILAEIYWDELVQRIVKNEGPPPGSLQDNTTSPTTYWCELSGQTWVQLLVRPDKRIRLIHTVREVLVINLADHPPDSVR